MIYNFHTMTKKDLFVAHLQNQVINFGFIPLWRRKAFVKFCIKHKFIEKISGNHLTSYYANYNFQYTATFNKVEALFGGILFELYADLFKPKLKLCPTDYTIRRSVRVKKTIHRKNPIYTYIQVLSNWIIR